MTAPVPPPAQPVLQECCCPNFAKPVLREYPEMATGKVWVCISNCGCKIHGLKAPITRSSRMAREMQIPVTPTRPGTAGWHSVAFGE